MKVVINDNDSKEGNDQRTNSRAQRCGKEIQNASRKQDCKIKSGEVMVQEQLTLHNEKWKIVKAPSNGEKAADCVIFNDSTLLQSVWNLISTSTEQPTMIKILIATLVAQNQDPSRHGIKYDGPRAKPPNKWIPKKINLSMALHPEILLPL
jgi:hypothetical protein